LVEKTEGCHNASMTDKALTLPEQLAWREIQQGTYHADLWEKALAESQGDKALARAAYIRLRTTTIQGDLGRLMAKHIRAAVAEDLKRPADFKSVKDLYG
jgi:hypothetical protein